MKPRSLAADEKRLWQAFTRDVALLRQEDAVYDLTEIMPEASSHSISPANIPTASLTQKPLKPTVPMVDLVAGDISKMDAATSRRLRRNQMEVEASLDLHGYTQSDAMHQFHHFLSQAVDKHKRVVRVITGYGKMQGSGVLRAALPRWVNLPENRQYILAYHQAHPQEGGKGAWLILLKRKERLV